MGFPLQYPKNSVGSDSSEASPLAETSQYCSLKAANSRDRRCHLKKYHSLTLLYSSSNLLGWIKPPVHLPAENGKKASRGMKFPSLSRKWPGLNCRGVSHCSGSYRTDAIFGIMMVPCKEKSVGSVLSTSLSPISFCLADKTAACCHFFVTRRYDLVTRPFS